MISNNRQRFNLLSQEQIYQIHRATLKILERTGVDVYSEEGLSLLRSAGCTISEKRRVKIPSEIVEEAIKSAPSKIVIFNRDGEKSMVLGGNNVYFGTGSDCVYTIDCRSKERRKTVRQDIADATLVSDYLPNIDFVMSLGIASDYPVKHSYIHAFQAMVENTKKPIVFTAADKNDCSTIIEIASAVVGSYDKLKQVPFIINFSEADSPLVHSEEAVGKLLLCAGKEIPVVYISGPASGATGPITLAGVLAQANAEALSALVMHQLKKKGAPIISEAQASIMDMRESTYNYGGPETRVVNAASHDIYHYYRIPVFGYAGCSDSNILDEQAAIESSLWCLMSALSGANLVHDVGFLGFGLIASLQMVVMTDEIIAMVKRMMEGIEINKETLALSVIDRVGPGGHFLVEDHTLRHLRGSHWYPKLLNRKNFQNWEREGKKTLGDKLDERVKDILKEHIPEPLSQGIKRKVNRIIEKYQE